LYNVGNIGAENDVEEEQICSSRKEDEQLHDRRMDLCRIDKSILILAGF
jgi:hypothetical protein